MAISTGGGKSGNPGFVSALSSDRDFLRPPGPASAEAARDKTFPIQRGGGGNSRIVSFIVSRVSDKCRFPSDKKNYCPQSDVPDKRYHGPMDAESRDLTDLDPQNVRGADVSGPTFWHTTPSPNRYGCFVAKSCTRPRTRELGDADRTAQLISVVDLRGERFLILSALRSTPASYPCQHCKPCI